MESGSSTADDLLAVLSIACESATGPGIKLGASRGKWDTLHPMSLEAGRIMRAPGLGGAVTGDTSNAVSTDRHDAFFLHQGD